MRSKFNLLPILLSVSGAFTPGVWAATQQASSLDAGGTNTTSASYSQHGSLGSISNISSSASPEISSKTGYLGQIYDITGITLFSESQTIDEEATAQLSALKNLDDGTFFTLPASNVTWGVVSGPLTGINAGGVVTANAVASDSSASVSGTFESYDSLLSLTVLDVVDDNFGTYAGDGLDDAWQVDYFGEDNYSAGPSKDPDGDGQDNNFEFTAGLDPTDSSSKFSVQITGDEQGRPEVIFNPVFTGKTYTVKYKNDLTDASWSTLINQSTLDQGVERTVTDVSTETPSERFYIIDID